MDSREIKLKARKFIKEFDVHELNYGTLKSAIERQGYTLVEYNHIFNEEDVSRLIEVLKLSDNIVRSRGFTYADQNYRIVFVHEDLSDAEKMVVLSHEAGHIYLGHMSSTPVIGRDVQEEHEANEFSHFLLHQGKLDKANLWVRRHKAATILAVAILALLITAGIVLSKIQTEKSYYGEYYITESGNKYHEKDCIFVKDKTNTHRMTIEEFESGEYEPCGICLP